MISSHPAQFRAAQFTREGGPLEIKTVEWHDPKEGEVIIKVEACGLSLTDLITRNNLLGDVTYPVGPGNTLYGKIVACGKLSKEDRHLKPGTRVCAVLPHDGLQEYACADAEQCCPIKHEVLDPLECCIAAWDGARVHASLRRFEREEKALNKDERRRRERTNAKLGFLGDGVICIYGEGRFARFGLDILKKACCKSERVMLLSPNDRWTAQDYGIPERDMIDITKQSVADELRKFGGARLIIAVDQPVPQPGRDTRFNGMCYGSQLVVLDPGKDGKIEFPAANLLVRNISVRGPPVLTSYEMAECLAFCEQQNLGSRIKSRRFSFDEKHVNEAWRCVEDGKELVAPVVVFQHQ
ncbi:hypothetical protein JCM5296_001607 [Sporobolomyces johnsonii]